MKDKMGESESEDSKHLVVFIEPSGSPYYDVEVVPLERDAWEEVMARLESRLEDHYMDNGWRGQLEIRIQFKKLTQRQIAEYLPEE